MAKVIILRGVSGCGKSTLAKTLEDAGYFIASADNFFIVEDEGYKFDASKLKQAHKYCFDNYVATLEWGIDVVVDNTNTTEKEMEKYIEYANLHGHKVTCLVVENRHGNDSIHNVPSDKRKQQAQRLQNSIKLI